STSSRPASATWVLPATLPEAGRSIRNPGQLPGAAVEWGAKQAYDYAEDRSTDEERKAAQQRGFSTDDTNPPRTQ
ncbi:hypothetical protein, partial [Kibdelosporangium philippinense]|uniref:hypothetical protein n=1 Tax=Kibdelosporangium philippinense TaxID=211113 RepID=UPI00361A240F